MKKVIKAVVATLVMVMFSASVMASSCPTPQLKTYTNNPVQSFLTRDSNHASITINLCSVTSYALNHAGSVLYIATTSTTATSTTTQTSGIRGSLVIHLFGNDKTLFIGHMNAMTLAGN